MLRVAEQYYGSDTGRQRRANEDSLMVRSPLFVVADGMGGAQAGEVASKVAVEAFEGGLPDPSQPEAALAAVAQAANHRIHELSIANAEQAGMGTTLTAIYVGEREVSIAHVGDSRAYCLRDGELLRLTDDHSLVDELLRQGRLTPEEAVEHPQRSVITRALGIEGTVDVDTRSFTGVAGDVYLVCSDGLTTMVDEDRIRDILVRHARLRDAGERLIAAANQAGGRDNITVVLLRLEEVGDGAQGAGDEPTLTGMQAVEAPAPATQAHAALEAPVQARRPRSPQEGRRPRRRLPRPRHLGALLAVLVLLLIVGAGALLALQNVYFIGTDEHGLVTLYQGVPFTLPGNIELYNREYVSGVSASTLSTRAPQHAARPLAALGSQRGLADPQPRTGTARMTRVNAHHPALRARGAAVRAARGVHLALDDLRSLLAARKPSQRAHAARAAANRPGADRGRATATVLARSRRGPEGIYQREYPTESLFANAIGYYFTDRGSTGLEHYRSSALNGQTDTGLQAILDQLQGANRRARRSSPLSTRARSAWPSKRSANTTAPSSRSNRAPARSP